MKLFQASYSPYVRMVRIVAVEVGVDSLIEAIDVDTWNPPAELLSVNPLGRIPTLVTDRGEAIYDSRVICTYLARQDSDGERLLPNGPGDWTLQATGIGLIDLMVERYVERCRPIERQMPDWIQRRSDATRRCLDALEERAATFGRRFDLGTIAIACALDYSAFRFPEDRWASGRPALSAWHADLSRRESMVSARLRNRSPDAAAG